MSEHVVSDRAASGSTAATARLGEPAPVAGLERSGAPARESAIKSRYTKRDYVLRRALALADVLAIGSALGVAFLLGPGRPLTDILLLIPTLPLWMVLFRTYGLYEPNVTKVRHGQLDDLPQIFNALVIGALGTWVLYRFAFPEQLVMVEMLAFGVAGLTLIPTWRLLARRAVARLFGPQRVLFLGDDPIVGTLARKMDDHPEYGLEPVGLLTVEGADAAEGGRLPVLGSADQVDLPALVEGGRVERVIVSTREIPNRDMLDVLQECRSLTLKVSLLPDHVYAMGPSVTVDDVEGVTILDLNQLVLSRSSRFLKRAMDVFGSSLGLVLSAPLLLVASIAIKVESRGPVLFRQKRVGRGSHRFSLLKFRTMVSDAESQTEELRSRSADPHWLKIDDDPRITRVGRILRHLSLDELPQLWNVLRGDMSLVGPRPLVEIEDRQVIGWERTRLDLAPGITGLWQVMGRTNIPFEEMTKLDYLYVTNWSLWTDVKLVLRTLPIIVTRRGAN